MNELEITKSAQGGKFLTFFLDDEEYGMEIEKVQEIISMLPITRVPRTPEFVRGVVNLRGKIIPVTNLRSRFGMDEGTESSESCIIIVRTNGLEIGVVVDKVSEVVDIQAADIKEVPSFGTGVRADFFLGIGSTNGNVRLLLDIDKVLLSDEIVKLDDMMQTMNA